MGLSPDIPTTVSLQFAHPFAMGFVRGFGSAKAAGKPLAIL